MTSNELMGAQVRGWLRHELTGGHLRLTLQIAASSSLFSMRQLRAHPDLL